MFAASTIRSYATQQLRRSFSSKVVILGSVNNNQLDASVRHAVTASKGLGLGDASLLLTGADCKAASLEASKLDGIANVLIAEDARFEHDVAEDVSALVTDVVKKEGFSHVVATSTTLSKGVIPRVGVALGVQPITDLLSIENADTFTRPIYAGNAIATVQSLDDTKILTIRNTAFEPCSDKTDSVDVSNVDVAASQSTTEWVKDELSVSERPELSSAKVVVSGGRGVGSKEGFATIESLADALHAAMGASRAAVDAGFCSNDMQVGQTGKVVAPDLYVAVGISGAIQHLAGMKDSKTIVAINKDAEAPIFQVADYGIVGDLFKIVPELVEKVK